MVHPPGGRLPQSTAVTGTYNDALAWAYFAQKREALLLWHEHLDKRDASRCPAVLTIIRNLRRID